MVNNPQEKPPVSISWIRGLIAGAPPIDKIEMEVREINALLDLIAKMAAELYEVKNMTDDYADIVDVDETGQPIPNQAMLTGAYIARVLAEYERMK